MRLLGKRNATLTLALTCVAATGCKGGIDSVETLPATAQMREGPAADYPIVVGDPYRIDGKLYTPNDTLNLDQVGFAALDPQGGEGVTGSHQTLPLPSYVEVTSLDTGRTILVRMERRGPMISNRIAALSPGALDQLGAGDGVAIRIRRVNPPELERAALRAGGQAPLRMDTPMSLVEVLRRKLDMPATLSAPPERVAVAPSQAEPSVPVEPTATRDEEVQTAIENLDWQPHDYNVDDEGAGEDAISEDTVETAAIEDPVPPPPPAPATGLVVQAAAFSTSERAELAAQAVGGFVERGERYWMLRTGPFASRAQAEASLAKVRAAGYSDARIITAP